MIESLKKNYKFIIFLIILVLLLNIRFPYYIETPGGISNVNGKIIIDGYDSTGSFNLAYVKEYKATIPTLIISLFNKDWNILSKNDVLLEQEDNNDYIFRDKMFMEESISNAIYVAFTKSSNSIKEISNKLYVSYVVKEAKTDIEVGDEILYINDQFIQSKKDISELLDKLNIGDKLDIRVINDEKTCDRYAYIIDSDGEKKLGLLISNVHEYETNLKIKINMDKNESGSSGGLIMALSIYNSLVKEDITKGLTIVGTGTIDLEGNIGSIGGVEYKLKSAVKSKADLFIVPNGENYDEAIKLKKKNKYNIEIIGVSTFDEVLEYLSSIN